MAQIIHNDLGRTKHFVAAAVAALGDFEDDVIGLAWVVPHGNRLVPVGIEGLADILDGLDAVAVEQLAQLLQRHRPRLDAMVRRKSDCSEARARSRLSRIGSKSRMKASFSRRGLLLGIAPGALFEIVEVGGETQVIVLLCGQLLLEYGWVSRHRISDGSGHPAHRSPDLEVRD